MRIRRYLLPAIVLMALLGIAIVAKLAGDPATKDTQVVPVDTTGAPNAGDIRGWMTLQDVSDTYGIPLAELYTGLGIPADWPPSTAMKELEEAIPNFETETARLWMASYLASHPDAAPAAVPLTHSEGTDHTTTPAPSGERLPGSEIKGQMTLSEIAEQCQVPLSYLLEQVKLDASADLNQSIKTLAETYGFEVGTIRLLITEYQTTHP